MFCFQFLSSFCPPANIYTCEDAYFKSREKNNSPICYLSTLSGFLYNHVISANSLKYVRLFPVVVRKEMQTEMCKYTSTGLCSAVMQARASFSLHDLETVGGPHECEKDRQKHCVQCNCNYLICYIYFILSHVSL